MTLRPPAALLALAAEMAAWRHHLHAHPELGFEERETAAFVADRLAEFGCDQVATGIGGTGVVAVIEGEGGGSAVGLRADMDALPVEEATGLPHASRRPGRMHACGHDGHVAMLLGAARHLAATRGFAGRVVLIFQPAEELGAGNAAMLRDGLLERFPIGRVFALHNWPGLPAGQAFARPGPSMAATADLAVRFQGRGGHGAMPHRGQHALLAAAQFLLASAVMVSHEVPAQSAALVTFGQLDGDGAWNTMPRAVTLRGTARWFEPEIGDLLERRLDALARAAAVASGLEVALGFCRLSPVVMNDPAAVALARAAAAELGPPGLQELPAPITASDDMAVLLGQVPGCYLLLGAGEGPGLHRPDYDFDDRLLPLGAALLAGMARQALAAGVPA